MLRPASYGTGKQGVALLPLALMLLLHLVLLLLWAGSGPARIDHGAAQRGFTLTWLAPPKPRERLLPPPVRVPRAHAAPAARPPQRATITTAPPIAVQPAVPPESTALPANEPGAVDVNKMLETARRQAGAIDRDLRGGKLAPLTPDANLPIIRFQRALEGAYIDRTRTLVTESLTQSDGVIVYRFRYGGKVWCRQSGGSAPGMMERSEGAKLAGAGSAGGGGAAGTIRCPGDETGWTRL